MPRERRCHWFASGIPVLQGGEHIKSWASRSTDDVSHKLSVRAGAAYGKQPIPSSDVLFNILAPAVTEWHFALGATAKTAKHSELSFAVVGVPGVTVSGPNPLEVPGQQRITLDMHQYEFEVGYAGKY